MVELVTQWVINDANQWSIDDTDQWISDDLFGSIGNPVFTFFVNNKLYNFITYDNDYYFVAKG